MRKHSESSPGSKTPGKRVVKKSALLGGDKTGTTKRTGAAKYRNGPGSKVVAVCTKIGTAMRTFVLSLAKRTRTPAVRQSTAERTEVRRQTQEDRKQRFAGNGKFYGGVSIAVALIIATAAVLCSGILLPREYDILVNDAGRVLAASTTEKTVGAFLEKNGILLEEGDVLAVSEDALLEDGYEIIIKRAFPVIITMGAQEYSIKMLAGTVQQAIDMAGITLGEHDEVYPVAETMINAGTEITIIEVTEEVITEEETLHFKEVTKKDSSLAKGKTKVSQEGENGLERHTIRVVYKNGVEVSREVIASEVVKEPVDKIILQGTYVAPVKDETPATTPPAGIENTDPGNSTVAGSNGWGDVNAEGKLVSVPTIAQIHQAGNLYEHNAAPAPDASIIAKTMYIDHVTAYTWTGSPTATGVYPKLGTVAACPYKFPYGTKVYVPGYGYGRIEDTGAFRGKEHTQFDLYMDSEQACRKWGRKRNYMVYILK